MNESVWTGKHGIDVDRVRADTPACKEVIHLHHSGSSLMPAPVYQAVTRHLDREYATGGYEAAAAAQDEIKAFYSNAAAMLGCDQSEIAYMENATAAWNSVFYGLVPRLRSGDRILTANVEYASNYIAYLHASSMTGCEIVEVPDDESGQLDCDALESMIDERVKLISITHVPTNGGLVNPAVAVGRIARSYDIPYLLDACQSAGQMPLRVDDIGCDALSCTGRKYLRGPRGTGILYVRASSMERLPPATLDLHGARWSEYDRYEMAPGAQRYENFENNVAGQIGLGVALEYANSLGLDAIYERIRMLASRLRQGLAEIPGITIRDKGREKCGIVSFTHEQVEPAKIQAALRERGINVGTSNSRSTLRDMRRRRIESLVRCPVHYFNSEEELSVFCARLGELVDAERR